MKPLPPVTVALDDRTCHNCGLWFEDQHLSDIGDCGLVPRKPGKLVPNRMTAPDQTCSSFEEAKAAFLRRAGEAW